MILPRMVFGVEVVAEKKKCVRINYELVGWLFGWLFGWLVGWWAGWLAGWRRMGTMEGAYSIGREGEWLENAAIDHGAIFEDERANRDQWLSFRGEELQEALNEMGGDSCLGEVNAFDVILVIDGSDSS